MVNGFHKSDFIFLHLYRLKKGSPLKSYFMVYYKVILYKQGDR